MKASALFHLLLVSLLLVPTGQGQVMDEALFSGLRYRCIGPTRGGRVTAVTGIRSAPGTFFMGSTGGGVWKTSDFGQSWRNVSDGFFASPSIGALGAAPSNEDILYVGTGSDGLRSNVITGRGVYRSDDAGKSWKFRGLRNTGHIGAVEIHPENPDVVYVAAIGQAFGPNPERGVYRSRDGGESWERVLFISDEVGAVDLELHPSDPQVIYACTWRAERKPWTIISGDAEGSGVHRSDDGGETWKKLGGGLPAGLFGKSDLAVSPAAPDRLYVLVEAPGKQGGLYRSDDRGEAFEQVSSHSGLLTRPFYYTNVDADPSDADRLFVSATSFYRSTDGGKQWRRVSTPHGDNHDLWIHPDDPKLWIQANDGGVNVTRDDGRTWSTQNNQPTAELYQVEVDDRFPYWVYAGQQDNSTIRVPSSPPYSHPAGAIGFWESIGGCETGPAVPKPGDPDIVYANCKGRFGRYNQRTGQHKRYYVGATNLYGHNPKDLVHRFQRVAPIHVSPHDPDVVYHASQYLHRTRDEGVTWERISPDLTANEPDKQVLSGEPITRDITGEEFYSTLYAIRESPLVEGQIWVGANDGPVHVTRDGGRNWENVTPEGLPAGGRVDSVEPSPHRESKAYIAVYRFLLGDWRPYAYRTDDHGQSWTLLTTGKNGIPEDTPVRVVREDPKREGLLYAGTEFGLYVSFDDGVHWQSLQRNLPVTPVTDIKLVRDDLVLSTMGRSFWILDDVTPLHELGLANTAEPHLFTPRAAYRTRGRGGSSRGGPEYLAAGALIHYALPREAKAVTLEILDHRGRVLRTVRSARRRGRPAARGEGARSSGAGGARPAAEQRMRGPTRRRRAPRGLATTPGMHRYNWNLRRDGPKGSNGRPGRGPLVVPGNFTLRLTVDGVVRSAPLQVHIDPRVADDGVTLDDLRAQSALSLEIMELQVRARAAAAEIRKRREALARTIAEDEEKAEAATQLDARLAEIQSRLVTKRGGAYQTPMLLDQISYLATILSGADQKPGRDAYERHIELSARLRACLDDMGDLGQDAARKPRDETPR